ncbi:probable protein phosphatase 2C T23F11.1 isoform X2 [Chrysoperla carnea]|uniref:probable protein phosphatase 2C T23F11.1 isoform X2 n=1 Tax=Chrysoperla carnea TaxID=189513 RepID=UPI001D0700E6|nr:probable protein phosphatase 2C T23F11.1 isoform X2 [Chrysoperla carnea]
MYYHSIPLSLLDTHKSLIDKRCLSYNAIPRRVMGQTLTEPITSKESACVQNSEYRVGSSCMQGWRVQMEDSHTHILSLPDDPGTAFFAVYDGHGGAKVAQYAGKHLHKYVTSRCEYRNGDIPAALKAAFLELDQAMLMEESLRDEQAGSTAVTILIKDKRLYCANVGDSRAIASVNGQVEQLSFDHKPGNEIEMQRITAGGGWVEFNRVNGNLALSRALGDFSFKKNEKKSAEEQIVTANPDIECRQINENWEFVVIACDGIWDVLTNEEVLNFVRSRIGTGMDPEDICEELMMRCLSPDCTMAGLGCDNMTVVLICFLHGKSYEELSKRSYRRCKRWLF